MHYIGSKEKLLPFIKNEVRQQVGRSLHVKRFCDLFAGTGVVGRSFSDDGLHVSSNDAEYYSYLINHAYLMTQSLTDYESQLQELNHLHIKKGLIFQHYALGGGEGRHYFSDENAQMIDAMRQHIEFWYQTEVINQERYFLLLATLIEEVTYIANTASIFSAYLKTLKKTAQIPLQLKALHVKENRTSHHVFHSDSNLLIKEISGDILYLDPPYNLRQYGANYHLLNTIAEYKPLVPRGKTGLRAYYSSPYSRRKSAYESLKNLLQNARFSHIFLSYSSDGIIDNTEIAKLMKNLGHYHQASQEHKRFNVKNAKETHHKTTEYLHCLHVR
ncbi:MAG: DNA adenine methylase [Campylobacterota bacterium]|nr:DNA adenine methylase [Campylobacterota bacterium]